MILPGPAKEFAGRGQPEARRRGLECGVPKMPPKGPGNLPRLLAHDKALTPLFGRTARERGVGDDVLDVKDNKATVVTPADSIPEVAEAHQKAWAAFDRQDFDAAMTWFRRAISAAERRGAVAYKSSNTLALVYTAMADWQSAMRQTSCMKRLIEDAPPDIRARFRMALHTNRGAIYSREGAREANPVRQVKFFHLSYREHRLAAAICLRAAGTLDTERAWNVADAACRLRRFEETAEYLSAYWRTDPHLADLLATHSRQNNWPDFLSLYHESGGRFIPAQPERYRVDPVPPGSSPFED
jgi:tetratricopeptide (TPR) repeat protein